MHMTERAFGLLTARAAEGSHSLPPEWHSLPFKIGISLFEGLWIQTGFEMEKAFHALALGWALLAFPAGCDQAAAGQAAALRPRSGTQVGAQPLA